jgi:hypothetical protein
MSVQICFVLFLSILHAILFGSVDVGINIVLYQLAFGASLFYLFPYKRTDRFFWLVNLSLLGSSICLGFFPNSIAKISYYTGSIILAGSLVKSKHSIPFTLLNGIYALSIGWITNTKKYLTKIRSKTRNSLSQKQLIIYGLPFIVTVFFIHLYSSANPTFHKLFTSMENRIVIDFSSLFEYTFYLFVGYCSTVAYTTPIGHKTLLTSEKVLGDSLRPKEKQTKWLNNNDEKKLSIILLGSLNVVLFIFHLTDLPYLFTAGPDSVTLSEYLHQGINTLSISIILATGIILYIFRNTLNLFRENKALRIVASAWIIQNSFLIATSVWKNTAYIAAYGLTYKRIGVYLFLSFVLTGLITTAIKIRKQQSLWRYVKNNTQIAFASMALMGFVHWDLIISKMNTSSSIQAAVDVNYLLSLDNPDIQWLDRYFTNDPERILNHRNTIQDQIKKLSSKDNDTWKSWPNRQNVYVQWLEKWDQQAQAQSEKNWEKQKNTITQRSKANSNDNNSIIQNFSEYGSSPIAVVSDTELSPSGKQQHPEEEPTERFAATPNDLSLESVEETYNESDQSIITQQKEQPPRQ